MIVRASDPLSKSVRTALPPKTPRQPPPAMTWTGHSLVPAKTTRTDDAPPTAEVQDRLDLPMPDWLREALQYSDVLVLDTSDYYGLPAEIRTELEILSI